MLKRWVRAAAAAMMLLALLVGVPVMLIWLAGWPLPTAVPEWGQVATRLRQTDIPADVVVKAIAVVVWVAWLQLAWAVLWELTVNVPRADHGRRHREAPLVVAPVSSGVARLFAAILAVGALASSPASAARGPLPTAALASPDAAATVIVGTDDASPTVPATSSTDGPRFVAATGDSLWSIAEQTLGDGSRVGEILALNPGLSARHVAVGTTLRLPVDAVVPATPAPAPTPPASAPAAPETITVEDNDTVWDITEERRQAAGLPVDPASVAADVAATAALSALEDPNLIHTGQQLTLPPLGAPIETTPPEPAPSTVAAPSPAPTADGMIPVIHVFAKGENLWNVMEAHHGYVTADMIWTAAADSDLADPSDIAVGQAVIIAWEPAPVAPPLPATEAPAPPAPPPVVDAPPAPTVAEPPPIVEPPPTSTVPSAPPITTPALPSPSEAPAQPSVTASTAPDVADRSAAPIDDGAGDSATWFDWSPRSLWWSVPAGVLLAAGVATMIRRLRLRRMSRLEPGEGLAAAPVVAAGTEAAVAATGAEARLSTLQRLLRTVTPYAREQHDPPPVRAVELAADRVEVVFASPAPFPPQGWTTVNGGASWSHRFDPPAAPSVQQLVTPALVTLGARGDDGEVLLDLETAGSLAIGGDRATSLGMARAMALELATYPLGVPMDVCLIGFDVDGTELCDRTWRDTTLTRAVRVARDVLDRTAATGAASLIAARAALDADEGSLDPQVFLVDVATVATDDDIALLDELVALCTPQSGAAVVVIGEHAAVRERITAVSPDRALWAGAELRPIALAREAVAQVAVTFDHAANAEAVTLSPPPVVAELLDVVEDPNAPVADADVAGDASDPEVVLPYRYQPPTHDVLIQVLGDVAVHGRPVTTGPDVELLTLLAFMRDVRPNIDLIRTLLDRQHDLAAKTVRNRLSALRSKLGVDADGNELLGSTPASRGQPARHCVSSRLLTDVDLIEHRYHTALSVPSGDALPVLEDGLSLFRGPAFRGPVTGYSWAAPEGVLQRVSSVVIAYAKLLMELAFDRDDFPLVLRTVGHAGRVVDDPIALYPLQQVHQQMADESGDPDLAAAVVEARRRMRDHVDAYDPLAGQ